MTNSERILSNNNLIDQAIAKANSLPNADGGSCPSSASKKQVNFYDYDGTILYSYTVAEAQALTSLPTLPAHNGLICQGWNWSLEDIKSHNRAVDVGAMYITDDGKTRIYIHLEESRTSPMLGCCPNGTVTVDWGDGTTPDTLTGTSTSTVKWTPTHNYASAGDYVITLTVDGSMALYGYNSTNQYTHLLRHSSSADGRNYVYENSVEKVEIGNDSMIGMNAFNNCNSLVSITIPNGVTRIGEYAFSRCSHLASITIPNSITNIGRYALDSQSLKNIIMPNGIIEIYPYAFNSCNFLANIIIPNGATSIGENAFKNCKSLVSITIPSSITSIGNGAFDGCSSMKYYDFTSHTSVPTLANTNAFSGIPEDCKIKVPASLYDEWIVATNWSNYASYIVDENGNSGDNNSGGYGGIITFTVAGVTYQAEDGMTWYVWANSDYNSSKRYFISGTKVCLDPMTWISGVSPSDTIIDGYNYTHEEFAMPPLP